MSETKKSYSITEAVVRQRREARLVHGARSPHQITVSSKAQKRRILRQLGLKASDLDGVGAALLDNWSRSQGKVMLLDLFFEKEGFLDPQGMPRDAARIYFQAVNSARLSATRLAEHLKARGVKGETLESYLQETYGHDGGDG